MRAFSRFSALAAAAALVATPANAEIFPVNLKAPADSGAPQEPLGNRYVAVEQEDATLMRLSCQQAVEDYATDPSNAGYGVVLEICGGISQSATEAKAMGARIENMREQVCEAAKQAQPQDPNRKKVWIEASCTPPPR